MKSKFLFFQVIMLFFLSIACEKEEIPAPGDSLDPELTEEELTVIDNISAVPASDSTILMPNGQSVKEYLLAHDPDFITYLQKNIKPKRSNQNPGSIELLIAKLSYTGVFLGQRDKFNMPDEGDGKPAHYGLAYSYGSKQYINRSRPPAGSCNAEVYGLDCSGYVSFVFDFCGIPLLKGPADLQRRPDTLLNTLRRVYNDTYKIEVNDLGQPDPADFKTGDIIYWTNGNRAYHIGLVLKGFVGPEAVLVVAHSTGSGSNRCTENYTSLKRGVCLSDLSELLDKSRGKSFSSNYRIVRFDIKQINPCGNVQTVILGGQTYNTVQIGSQCWLKENLNVGSALLGNKDQANNGIIEKYCYNDNPGSCAIYGGLYQWGEAIGYNNSGRPRGICPEGWHIPEKSEWETLVNELGGSNKAGGKMKETGTSHWKSPNEAATNSSGFTALPGGIRWNVNGSYMWLGESGVFWSSTQYDNKYAWWCSVSSIFGYSQNSFEDKREGASVRCIKD